MSLHVYRKKRSFDKTPEPEGKEATTAGPLTFVVQKHQASRLHYDFRLELDGVLKSWAVPKGPSLNPDDKRLAVMVEDHPLEYANFEGIIPKGQYGGGTVMVWDRGVYSPIAFVDRKKAEILLKEQLQKGHLTFLLLGEKLKGEFALVRTHNAEENAWLLIKAHDTYASKKDILQKDTSVSTKRTMEQIKKQATDKDVWQSKPHLALPSKTKKPMQHHIKPMLAKSIDAPFDDPHFFFEMKYDGYRTISEIDHERVHMYSRNGISFDEKFAPIHKALTRFETSAVLDGEVVVIDNHGIPRFQLLQDFPKTKGKLIYYVFDLLYYDGHDLTSEPLYKRKEILEKIIPALPNVQYSDHIEKTGIAMFAQIKQLGMEGIIAKNKDSIYTAGGRSSQWLKIKTEMRQEVVIAGFTKPKGARNHFGALIAGIYKNDTFTYIGHVGGGFDEEKLKTIYKALQPLVQPSCPFKNKPKTNAPVTWVKPTLLAEVTFSNWTHDGQMRHPIFLGLREDKDAKEVKRETYFTKKEIVKDGKHVTIGKQNITLTNLSKIFWPKEKYTKGDLIAYYLEIASLILPYLKDRPQSLLRYPNGIHGKSFYQKNAALLDADWIKTTSVYSDSNNKDISYFLCQDEASLIYLINLGCIDLNPWSSRVNQLDKPDYLLIDLDPEETGFDNVIQTALTCRKVLEDFDIPSYCKTSGAKGMHIYIPLGAQYTYEQSRTLAQLLCTYVHERIPDITSMKRSPTKRKGLVYLDYLQNIKGQTLASAYSVRAMPGATVSAPLHWSEVTKNLSPIQFTIRNMPERIQKHGDIFTPVLKKGIDMDKVLKNIAKKS